MKVINGVLVLSDSDFDRMNERLKEGLPVVEVMEQDIIDKNGLDIEEIDSIKFHQGYFYLSSQFILSLPKLRIKRMITKERSLV